MKSDEFIELLKSHLYKVKLCTETTLTMIDLKTMAILTNIRIRNRIQLTSKRPLYMTAVVNSALKFSG